jgi:hypothetical protein
MNKITVLSKIVKVSEKIMFWADIKLIETIQKDYFSDIETLKHLLGVVPAGMCRFRIRQRINELDLDKQPE